MKYVTLPQTQDVHWTYIRRSEDVQDVFWTPYVRSIYVLCLGGAASSLKDHFYKEAGYVATGYRGIWWGVSSSLMHVKQGRFRYLEIILSKSIQRTIEIKRKKAGNRVRGLQAVTDSSGTNKWNIIRQLFKYSMSKALHNFIVTNDFANYFDMYWVSCKVKEGVTITEWVSVLILTCFARLFIPVLNTHTWWEKWNKESINVWWVWSNLAEIRRLRQLRN